MKEALYWKRLDQDKVKCVLCPHNCEISHDKFGFCGIRKNINGTLYATQYNKISSIQMDPIEKKPLYHFHPTTYILSIGFIGCNFRCKFCQNWHLIEKIVPVKEVSSYDIINLAIKHKSLSIAYTYNEPFINYEFVLETAKLAKSNGLKNVLVTNGFYNKEPFLELVPYIDALNIDLKYIREDKYKNISYGELEPVKETIKEAYKKNCHIEITNLIVPTINDSEEDIQEIVDFINSINNEIPVHFSRYHPAYKCDLPPTSIETMDRIYNIAAKKLKHVYVGNITLPQGNNTLCPNCGNLIINRLGYSIQIIGLKKENNLAKCNSCDYKLNLVI